jgi:DNA replication initiation complex subunit (GINS family)
MKTTSIRSIIKEKAKVALIDPSEEFYERVESYLESQINVKLLEKIRSEMINPSKKRGRKPLSQPPGDVD